MKKVLPFLILSVILVTCKKDENNNTPAPGNTTVEEDKQNINNTVDMALNCALAIRDGDVATALINFSDVHDGEFHSRDWMTKLIVDELSKVIDFEDIYNTQKRFDFPYYCGTYNWNIGSEIWEKSNTPSNKLIINFPSSETASTNNCTFTMDSYYDSNITMENETYWAPTSMNAILTVDGDEIVRIKVDDVQYVVGYYTLPLTMDIEIFVSPFTLTINAEQLSNTKYISSVSIVNDGDCAFHFETEVNLAHDNFESFDTDDDFRMSYGSISWGNIKLEFDANLRYLYNYQDLTEAEVNNYLNVDVLYNGILIGNLEYVKENGEGKKDFNIIYKDGSSESCSVYYDEFWNDFVNLVEAVTGEIF